MFSLEVVNTDLFLDMPMTTQALYFHLGLRADDDGFIASPKRVLRTLGCSEDDLKVLISKRYVIPFDSGVILITHWNQNNYIRQDRYVPTAYQNELSQVTKINGVFERTIPKDQEMLPIGILPDNQTVYPEENNTVENNTEKKKKNNNGSMRQEKCEKYPVRDVVEYLNQKAEKNFKPEAAGTMKPIIARFEEGYTLDDFKTVIDKKVDDWGGDPDMDQYLRPKTLFSPTNFEGYLNQKIIPKKNSRIDEEHPDQRKDYDLLVREIF